MRQLQAEVKKLKEQLAMALSGDSRREAAPGGPEGSAGKGADSLCPNL